MSLPICIELEGLEVFELPLPGGVSIEDVDVMRVIQPALTPLVPLFTVIDAAVALFNCVKAIPDALGPPPDPSVLAACLPDLQKKISKLLALIPLLCLPLTAARMVDLAIEVLREVQRKLQYLDDELRRIERATERARNLNDGGLMAILECAKMNVRQEAANVGKSLASLGRLLGLIDLFAGMFGGPKAPPLTALNGKALGASVDALGTLVAALQAVRKAIPVPPHRQGVA